MKCLAVFATFFDPHMGNVVEWSDASAEHAVLLRHLEMLVMGPGFQYTCEDHVLFGVPGREGLYGAAAFRLLKTDRPEERFGRMRSVGAIGTNLVELRRLIPVLGETAKQLNLSPGDYSRIIELACVLRGTDCHEDVLAATALGALVATEKGSALQENCSAAPLVIDDPFFLLMWKALLCRRRVLLYSRRRAGALCDICLDLVQCVGSAGADTAAPAPTALLQANHLLYRTIFFESELSSLPGGDSTWLIATTDTSLLLLRPLDWDVLLVLHSAGSEDEDRFLGEGLGVKHQMRRQISIGKRIVVATLLCSTCCDSRLYSSFNFSKEEKLWRFIESWTAESGSNGHIKSVSNTKNSLVEWRNELHRRLSALCHPGSAIGLSAEAGSEFPPPPLVVTYKQLRLMVKSPAMGPLKHCLSWLLLYCENLGISVVGAPDSSLCLPRCLKVPCGLFLTVASHSKVSPSMATGENTAAEDRKHHSRGVSVIPITASSMS